MLKGRMKTCIPGGLGARTLRLYPLIGVSSIIAKLGHVEGTVDGRSR